VSAERITDEERAGLQEEFENDVAELLAHAILRKILAEDAAAQKAEAEAAAQQPSDKPTTTTTRGAK
jgi:hypothetical protein